LVTKSLNDFFEGLILKDVSGEDMVLREIQSENSFKGKLATTKLKEMRTVTQKLMEGRKPSKLYIPIVTLEEFMKYREDGTVVIDDPNDVDKNAALAEATNAGQGSPKRKRAVNDGGDAEGKRLKQ
jgi:hypothetical protein